MRRGSFRPTFASPFALIFFLSFCVIFVALSFSIDLCIFYLRLFRQQHFNVEHLSSVSAQVISGGYVWRLHFCK